jgi:hypothetical protein
MLSLIVAVRENFEEELTDERMQQLRFLCGRFRVVRQVLSRRKPEACQAALCQPAHEEAGGRSVQSCGFYERMVELTEAQVGTSVILHFGHDTDAAVV